MIEVFWNHQNRLKFVDHFGPKKIELNSYVPILQRLLHSSLFFLLISNFEPKLMLSMIASTPMSLSPHTKWIHLCCDDYLDFHIIGYACVVGIDKNQRLWREIIPTIRGLKSSYFTQFTSNLAMLGMFHCIIHTYFTYDIQIILYLMRLGRLKWWITLHFIDYLPCCWLTYFASLIQHLREVTDIYNSKYHPICHLLSCWDERWRLVTSF